MSSSRPTGSRGSSSSRSKHSSRVIAQTPLDAKLSADFEDSNLPFHYSASSISAAVNQSSRGEGDGSTIPPSAVSNYLQRMQRGQLIQPFGCMIAVNESTLAVIAYSENAPEMLDLTPHAVPSIEQQETLTIGTDLRTIFRHSGVIALQKASSFADVYLLNPILVHCINTGKPFYAILHRIDEGLVVDLEPVNPTDAPVTAAGALKSYKLAAKSISKLQSLPSGNIPLLCDALVREVSELTGYDRVMAYKFHEDEHGEIIAEYRRSDLEPYLGLHYPATDIPQASRFLFMKNKIRMICDCHATPVKIIQDKKLAQPLSLSGSTLRAPHGCHAHYMANMGSIASLVMSVTINENDNETVKGDDQQLKERKLWGLVVCHHMSPRFVPFPLRYACEFLLQVFSIQLNKEVELAAQTREKHILRTQTLLCDMLLRDAPVGIFTQSPNVMDLVKCDGAALYYQKQFWLLGITPTESQIREIVIWLQECHHSTTGLSTDGLLEAGCPIAPVLGDAVCGMAAIKISQKDFIFWFRSHTAKEVRWGGAKNDPIDSIETGRRMHPRSSFQAFLEVVKWRSLPWEDVEMDAIHSLQLILRGSLQDEPVNTNTVTRTLVDAPVNDEKMIDGLNELQTVTSEMVRLIETANVPILAVDALGNINGWNTKAAELTGLSVEDAIGMPIIDLVQEDCIEVIKRVLSFALQGKEEQNVEFKLKRFSALERDGPVILLVNACCSKDVKDNIVGVCFIAQDVTDQKMLMDKYTRIQGDYVSIISNPGALIPPIFIIDENGFCTEWNAAIEKLTGLKKEDTINKALVGEVFSHHGCGCNVKDLDTLTKLRITLNAAMAGRDSEKLLFGFFDTNGNLLEVLLSATKRLNAEGIVIGVLCFLHVPSPELQHILKVNKISEQSVNNCLKELSYLRQEIKKPLQGIVFAQRLMEASGLTTQQKQILRTSALCQGQLAKILDDANLEYIEESFLQMTATEFNLGESLDAIVSQGKNLSMEKQVQLIHDSPLEVSSMCLCGDNLRLQQALSNFLLNALWFTPSSMGSVVLHVKPKIEHIGAELHVAHLEFRIVHPAPGIPDFLIQQMFQHKQGMSTEGLCMHVSHELVRSMNGTVQYLREAESSSFIITIKFPLVHHARR